MLATLFLLVLSLLSLSPPTSALGTSCTKALRSGTAQPGAPYWMQSIKHQGLSAYNSDPANYQVFRNVKDYGAKGDGKTDDTAAINLALSSGGRCGGGNCSMSTVTPAVVYFPVGTYIVSSPIFAYYYTQLIGDARTPPTLQATAGFSGIAVIDSDPYVPNGNGAQWYGPTNNMYRSVRNLVIDLRMIPANTSATGLHWQASQATSLINVVFWMSSAGGTNHQGIYMENGSGGFMGDIVFNGGKYGIYVGNQQFTVRNITINNAVTGIYAIWNWGWTFQNVNINNCSIGFDLSTATGDVGAEAIVDATVTCTPIFVLSSVASTSTHPVSLVLTNIHLTGVPIAVGLSDGTVVLSGTSGTSVRTIESWGQGNIYSGTTGKPTFKHGSVVAMANPPSLLTSSGQVFGKTHPQFQSYDVGQFVSVRDEGAMGDGVSDDTDALKAVFSKYSNCKIIFFDQGTYIVTSTLLVPSGTRIVGEAWSVIAGRGPAFQDQTNPTPVVQVGHVGSSGPVEIVDMIFSTVGPAAGAVVVEWNVHESFQGSAGMWDTHIRIGGSAGTDEGVSGCGRNATIAADCAAAFLGLHLTPKSSAYLEGTWVWLADHNIDPENVTEVRYSGRGILSESAGPTWMIGTASEHHSLYQYNLVGAENHYIGLLQTETPYYQPTPNAPAPFNTYSAWNDPTFNENITSAWGLNVISSCNVVIYGAGFYSFFQFYNQGSCYSNQTCQTQMVNIDTSSSIRLYSVTTVGVTNQLSVSAKPVIKASVDMISPGEQSTFTFWALTTSTTKRGHHHSHNPVKGAENFVLGSD